MWCFKLSWIGATGKHNMEKLIFDNSNLNESYSGITTPLTFSFARRVYRNVYKEFSRVIGVNEKKIDEHEYMFQSMLSYIGCRMYYNLLNWYRLISFVPGYKYNRSFLEKMLGVSKETYYNPKHTADSGRKTLELFKLGKQIIVVMAQFLKVSKNVNKFLEDFDVEIDKANKVKLGKLSDKDLIDFYITHEKKFTTKWRVTIVNDLALMITSGFARKLANKWLNDKNNIYINGYLANIRNLESTKPGEDFTKIVLMISENSKYLDLFQKPPERIHSELNTNPLFNNLKRTFELYLKNFGDRSPSELKLESMTFNNNKYFLISLIKNQLSGNIGVKDGKRIRKAPTIDKRLNNISFLKRWIFILLIRLTRDYIKNREAARLRRSQVFGLARRTFREFGSRFAKVGYIEHADDIFFLEVEEILGISNGTSIIKNLQVDINKRKAEMKIWQRINLPERVETKSVYKYQMSILAKNKFSPKKKFLYKRRFTGVTYSLGENGDIIKGKALVMKSFDPGAEYTGKILITTQTDPGWTPIFPGLKAIIVERGGMLSHAAIVAREFGLPCISQVVGATDMITSGQNVTIDVKSGVINIS